jgi:hypothetical protein
VLFKNPETGGIMEKFGGRFIDEYETYKDNYQK